MMIHTIGRKYEIVMGHEGETGYRTVAFDVSMFPEDAVVFLDYVRYGEYVPYPINLERKGSVAYWYPNEIDTAFRGTGRGQLVCMRGDELIGKSDVFKLINRFSLSHDEEAPSGYENWLQELERIAASVVSGVDAGKAEIDAEIESGKAEINRTSAEAVESINTAKTEAVNTVNSAKNDGINRLNDRIESGKAEINTAKTTALDSIESKKEAVHTELDGYVEAHHDELKGEKGDAYVVTEEDLKEIGDRVEAEYEPQLNGLKEEVSHKAEATDLATANRKIKALTDVLNGKELAFETTDYESAKVEVPSGAVADSILKIGGKSVVWNQLIKAEPSSRTRGGVDINVYADGKVTLNGTCTASDTWNISLPSNTDTKVVTGHKYLLLTKYYNFIYGYNAFVQLLNPSVTVYFGVTNDAPSYAFWTATATDTMFCRLRVQQGADYNNVVIYPMLFDLTVMGMEDITVEEFEKMFPSHYPYNEGELRSSQTDAVGVRGKNLFDGQIGEDNRRLSTSTGGTWGENGAFVSNKIEVVGGEQYIFSASEYGTAYMCFYDSNGLFIDGGYLVGTTGTKYNIVAPSNARYFKFDYKKEYIDSIQLEKGSTATPYSPYSYKEIPTNLPPLRSAGSVSDERVYGDVKKQYTRIGAVDLGDISWAYIPNWGEANCFNVNTALLPQLNFKAEADGRVLGNILCAKYPNVSASAMYSGEISFGISVNSNNLKIVDPSYTNAATFKNAMSGVMLYYELAEPIITDIDPMPQLEAINVEAGGEVSFIDKSDMDFPIPTTHEWVVRNSEV